MVAYTGIQGQNILIVSSDPSNPVEGQIWYNSTSNLLKGYQFATVNAWASGGTLGVPLGLGGQVGTQTAAVVVGGGPYVDSAISGKTQLYNGTSWTTSPASTNTIRQYIALFGLQTAAIAFGGENGAPVYAINSSESWNGTSWTNTNTLPTTIAAGQGVGTQTAGLAMGGTYLVNGTISWNGTSWSSVPATLNTAGPNGRCESSVAGVQTAALIAGGSDGTSPPYIAATESYNGTAWTTVNSLNTARTAIGGAGTQTAALAFGGAPSSPAVTGATELWNGTSWTNNPNSLSTAREGNSGVMGTQTASLLAGGRTPRSSPGNQTITEEWTGSTLQTKTITTS